MPTTAPDRRPQTFPPFAGPAKRRFARLPGGAEPPAGEPPETPPVGRLEADLLRAAALAPDAARLLRDLHRLTAPRGGPATSVLLAADGSRWRVRAAAGAELPPDALPALPGPGRCGENPGPLDPAPAYFRGAWAVPLTLTGTAGLWVAPPPPVADLNLTVAAAVRLWGDLGGALRKRLTADDALAAATARLALRDAQVLLYAAAAAGGEPRAVLARLLDALRTGCGADRAALRTPGADGRRVASAGPDPVGPVAAVLADRERAVVASLSGRPGASRPATFDAAGLARCGVSSLIGLALAAPVGGAAGPVLLVTKADAGPFPPHAAAVLGWAAEFFAETLPRSTRSAAARRLARKDGLTGLANRRAFDERLAALASAAVASGGDLTLLMCDLDRFKAVNDTHGHQAGDEALRDAAAAVEGVLGECRSDDAAIAARYGGEELAVLLPDFGPAGGVRVAERVRRAVSGVRLPGGSGLTVSVGAAVLPFDAADAEGLIAAADAALYRAKRAGRNRVERAGKAEVAAIPR